MKFKLLFLFVLCCSAAYLFTDNTYTPSTAREPSSTEPKETRNGYSKLSCPTEKEFMKWAAELHLDPIEGPSLDAGCKNKTMRTQLAQVLALAKEIKINFPKNWAPSVQAEIKNSYEYIRMNTNQLKIDLTQVNSVARNLKAQKQIELGGMFFKEEPLEALSVLIHEARHSDTNDQGHTTCNIGDIPKTQGGCDEFFSNKSENAGAYGYGTLYELALAQYSDNLDDAERELMVSNAFTSLSTRFNNFSSSLAKHYDIATVLLEDGTLAWVHPYSLQLIPLKIELPKFQEKFKKIEFSPRTNSLLLFTESDRLFVWGPRFKTSRPSPEATTEDDKFTHISRQYVPVESTKILYSARTLYVSLKTNGQLEFITYDPVKNKQVILPYPLQSSSVDPNPKVPNLKHFALAHSFSSYFLDKQGVLMRAPFNIGSEANFIVEPAIQSDTGGWKTLTGGVFYDDLILTDSDGKLYNVTVEVTYKNGGTEEEEEIVTFTKHVNPFQSVSKARKYHQGLQIHGVVDEDGSLSLENYRVKDSRVNLRFDKKVVDLVITRTTLPESQLYKSTDFKAAVLKKCNIRKVIENVGYGSVLGLTHDNKLVSGNSDDTCTTLSETEWTHAEVEGLDDDPNKRRWERRSFPDVYLKLSNQKDKQTWVPYTKPVGKL